jgi:hypothetical protein
MATIITAHITKRRNTAVGVQWYISGIAIAAIRDMSMPDMSIPGIAVRVRNKYSHATIAKAAKQPLMIQRSR